MESVGTRPNRVTFAIYDDELRADCDCDGFRQRGFCVVRAVQNQDMTYDDAAGLVEYGEYWVGERVREWRP